MYFIRIVLLSMAFYATIVAANWYTNSDNLFPSQPDPKEVPFYQGSRWYPDQPDLLIPSQPESKEEPLDYFESRRVEMGRSRYKCCEYGQCSGYFEKCTSCNTCVKRFNVKEIFKCKVRPSGSCLRESGGGSPTEDTCRPDSKARCNQSWDCYNGMEQEQCVQGRCMPEKCLGGKPPGPPDGMKCRTNSRTRCYTSRHCPNGQRCMTSGSCLDANCQPSAPWSPDDM